MWVMLSDAFLSIVQHRDNPELLCVRARVKGDLERVFPAFTDKVVKTPDADYLFRVVLPRDAVRTALTVEVDMINYDNFKNSVPDQERHDAYLDCWVAMNRLQQQKASPKKVKGHVGRHPKERA